MGLGGLWVQDWRDAGMGLVWVRFDHGGRYGFNPTVAVYGNTTKGDRAMGHTLALMFEQAARLLYNSVDGVPERMFHLMSGVVLIAVAMRLRRSFE